MGLTSDTFITLVLLFISLDHGIDGNTPCASRDYGRGSVVCVCNETYCDDFDPLTRTKPHEVTVFESNKKGLRVEKSVINILESPQNIWDNGTKRASFKINRVEKYQTIIGFGGALTDASGINILSLPSALSSKIIENYFSETGLEYSMARVPVGGTDFSTRKYTYDDVEDDFDLKHFNLTDEDIKYKIPLIRLANAVSPHQIKYFASAWSAPAWLKTNGDLAGKGHLIGEAGDRYHKTWANYYVKFFDAYKEEGIDFWGLTTGNEPNNGFIYKFPFNCMAFSAETQRDFIKVDLGPALEEGGYGVNKLKLIILDDQRIFLPLWADIVIKDTNASRYVSGIGFHWYENFFTPLGLLDITHKAHPDHFLLSTEACEGSFPWQRDKVILGSWERAQHYAKDIIDDLLHWTTGWIDWNLAVNLQGGPSWVGNFVDSPIVINATAKEAYKQPMFYALAHFSKLLPPGSVRIGLNPITEEDRMVRNLDVVAFETPTNGTVIIVLNRNNYPIALNFTTDETDEDGPENVVSFGKLIAAHSIQSYLWFP